MCLDLSEPSSRYSTNCDELMVQKASLSMFWEYSPSSANVASDWMRGKISFLWMKKEKMDDGVDTSLASEKNGLFLIDLWDAQPCLWDT